MKNHPEIKWTEIVRRAIMEYLAKIEEPEMMTIAEMRARMDSETLDLIDELAAKNTNLEESLILREKTHAMDVDRVKHLQRLERGED
nr:hypothetical protein [Candidatus Sigynarchaeota archaeon]